MRPSKGDPAQYLRAVVQPGWTVVDGGANKGDYVGLAAECVGPTGTVVAIEPDERCWTRLEAIQTTHSWVRIERVALLDVPQQRTLHQGRDAAHSALCPEAVDGDRIGIGFQVLCQRLDGLVSKADVVKLDVQGSEMAALRGAPDLLRSCDRWIVELWPHGIRMSGDNPDLLVPFMQSYGFSTFWLDQRDEEDAVGVSQWLADAKKPKSYVNLVFERR